MTWGALVGGPVSELPVGDVVKWAGFFATGGGLLALVVW
jgi:hypothetical protein